MIVDFDGWYIGYNCKGCNIFGYDSIGCYDGINVNCDFGFDYGVIVDLCVMVNGGVV